MKINHIITNVTSCPFSNRHVQLLFEKYIHKICEQDNRTGLNLDQKVRIVDPFAREYRQRGCVTISNDLNPIFDTTFNMEANDFGEYLNDGKTQCDLILFDPPYTLRMLKEHYDGIGKDLKLWQTNNMWGRCKDNLAHIIRIGGYVISFGYHSHGFGKHRGFEKREILIMEQGGSPDRYDVLVTVEQKMQLGLSDFFEDE